MHSTQIQLQHQQYKEISHSILFQLFQLSFTHKVLSLNNCDSYTSRKRQLSHINEWVLALGI